MAKKQYISPVLASLTPDPDPEIPFGGSQGTSGEDSPYSFSGIDDDTLDLIYANSPPRTSSFREYDFGH